MSFKDKYATEAIKAEILKDDKVSAEVKKAEEKKMIVSNDTFALGELIEELKGEIKRVSALLVK